MEKERLAEFVGIMLGDGSIGIYNFYQHKKAKKLHQLKVTLDSRNKEYINYVYNLMKRSFMLFQRYFTKRMKMQLI